MQTVYILAGHNFDIGMKTAWLTARAGFKPILLSSQSRTALKLSKIRKINLSAGDCYDLDSITCNKEIRADRSCALLPVWLDDFDFVTKHRTVLERHFILPLLPERDLFLKLECKDSFYAYLRSINLPVPSLIKAEHVADTLDEGTCLLAKPVHGIGGGGILRLSSKQQYTAICPSYWENDTWVFQRIVGDVDVDLTIVANKGRLLGCVLRKEWFVKNKPGQYSPVFTKQYFRDHAIEALASDFAKRSNCSGVIDFDLRIDSKTGDFWFIDCNPRLFGSTDVAASFDVNIPALLLNPEGPVRFNEAGHYLNPLNISDFIKRALQGGISPRDLVNLHIGSTAIKDDVLYHSFLRVISGLRLLRA